MGSRYLLDLAEVCRRTGRLVHEVDGWEHIARGSGGYSSGAPNHVMVHHTASGPASDGWSDVNYMTFGADAAPLANVYLSRTGQLWVMAGGATNTNGSGIDPCRRLAEDTMNANAIGIEAANGGTGEPWAAEQLDCYEELCRQLGAAYGIAPSQTHGHAEYAPSRKIDPAGPPRYASGSATWNMDAFRSVISVQPPHPQPPPSKEDTVIRILASHENPPEFNAVFFAECDAQGRSIEVQWSGDGDDPRVQKRLKTMQDAFGDGPGPYGSYSVLLAGLRNNRLHPKHRPSDIRDSRHVWTEDDFAP